MIPLPCRLQTLRALHYVIFKRIHMLYQLDSQHSCATRCIHKWTHFESGLCFFPQQKIGFLSLGEIRSFSTDPESNFVHIVDSNSKLLQKMTLKKARIMAHKESMLLFHVRNEGANDFDEYKLLSEDEFHKAVLKDKVEQERIKMYKEFHFGVSIQERDLSVKLKSIKKRLLKGSPVRIVLLSHGFNQLRKPFDEKRKADADRVLAACVEEFKNMSRVTKVTKGKKMYIIEFESLDGVKSCPK